MNKPIVKIKLLDEVNAAIIGLSNNHLKYFYDEYARRPPNHFFNPKFKLGVWDGYIRYFLNTGKTYVYLLDQIIPQLIKFGYELEVVDQRVGEYADPVVVDKDYFSHIIHPDYNVPIELRPYQVSLLNALIENGGGIGIAGTGAGKTLCSAVLADVYGNQGMKTLTVVPNTDLISQTKEEFIVCGLDTGEYSGDCKDLDHQHCVSTWQALQNNPTIISNFGMVLVDECHGLRGQVLTKLLNEYGKNITYRFGVTGTLPTADTDAMAVRIAVGSVQYTIKAHELIEQDYLASLNINIIQLEEDLTVQYNNYLDDFAATPTRPKPISYIGFKNSYFPEYSAEKRYLQTDKGRIEWMANFLTTKRDVGRGNIFCLVDGVGFGKKLTALIEGAVFVHGKDKRACRKEIYDQFDTKDDLLVIATVNIASVGLNLPRIFEIITIDASKSQIRVIQSIGRGLRKAHDKDHVVVTDICSDLKYAKKHVRERIKYYTEANYPYKKKKIKYNPS